MKQKGVIQSVLTWTKMSGMLPPYIAIENSPFRFMYNVSNHRSPEGQTKFSSALSSLLLTAKPCQAFMANFSPVCCFRILSYWLSLQLRGFEHQACCHLRATGEDKAMGQSTRHPQMTTRECSKQSNEAKSLCTIQRGNIPEIFVQLNTLCMAPFCLILESNE